MRKLESFGTALTRSQMKNISPGGGMVKSLESSTVVCGGTDCRYQTCVYVCNSGQTSWCQQNYCLTPEGYSASQYRCGC